MARRFWRSVRWLITAISRSNTAGTPFVESEEHLLQVGLFDLARPHRVSGGGCDPLIGSSGKLTAKNRPVGADLDRDVEQVLNRGEFGGTNSRVEFDLHLS